MAGSTNRSEESPYAGAPHTEDPGAVVISDLNQLARLRANVIRSGYALRIEVPGIPAERGQAAAERIRAFATECGCSMGAKSMAAAFSMSFLWLAVSHGILNSQFAWRLPWTFLWAVTGAIGGKVIGIVHARRQLRNEINGFIAALPAQEF
jgi:hypothetical protein